MRRVSQIAEGGAWVVKILLATHNKAKLAELRRIVEGLGVHVLSLAEIEEYPEPAETEWTFEGNALIKAREGCRRSGLACLADDSGLCVDALGSMPGVRSSRWAGTGHDDQANLELVLRQIDDVAEAKRGAQFVAVVALVLPDGREFTVRGEISGHLTRSPRGDNGFGYDPIFVADDEPGKTTAELSAERKDEISHRGKALRAMVPILADALGIKVEGEAKCSSI